jgi:hypothetical protein
MNLQHEAILSLNTRVRRIRYLIKALDLVSDTSVSLQLLIKQFVDYGLSQLLYDEITKAPSEPFSGHFFENISQSYEQNMEKRSKRQSSNAERVAESYLDLALKLRLLVESNQRFSASQLSMPIRFWGGREWLPLPLQLASRNRYILALLWRFDRDLTCPLLLQLLRERRATIDDIEAGWNTWEATWINRLIELSTKQSLGNPAGLLRYLLFSTKARKKPARYAEHTALIRFHWFIDLGVAEGQPPRNPKLFTPAAASFEPLHRILEEMPSYLACGDIARIHFEICKATSPTHSIIEVNFSQIVTEFLKAARIKGASNVRLNLLDIIWTSMTTAANQMFGSFDEFCDDVDRRLKAEGVTVVKAPQRDETYIPTQQ